VLVLQDWSVALAVLGLKVLSRLVRITARRGKCCDRRGRRTRWRGYARCLLANLVARVRRTESYSGSAALVIKTWDTRDHYVRGG